MSTSLRYPLAPLGHEHRSDQPCTRACEPRPALRCACRWGGPTLACHVRASQEDLLCDDCRQVECDTAAAPALPDRDLTSRRRTASP